VSYLVLARKWRPQRFSEVVGQPHVTTTFLNGLRQKRLAHAYLLSGPRGVGKTTTARLLARAVNCLEPQDGEPCNECRLCQAALEGRALDVLEVDAASNTGVEKTRELIENVHFTPIEGVAKVYVIDEVHMLSASSFNALLKTLEEPPPHAYFCLATTAPQKVPSTILSRCQRFDFRRVPAAEIRAHLEMILTSEGLPFEVEALDLIARKADGSVRDSLSLLDQVIAYAGGSVRRADTVEAIGEVRLDLFFRAIELTLTHSVAEAFRLDGDLAMAGIDPQDYLSGLQGHIVQLLQVKALGSGRVDLPPEARAGFDEAARKAGEADLIRMLNLASAAEVDIRRNYTPRVRLQLLFLKYATLDRSVDLSEVLGQMGKGGGASVAAAAPVKTAPVPPPTQAPRAQPARSASPAPVAASTPKPAAPTLPDDQVLAAVQNAWDEIWDEVAVKHNSSARLVQAGGWPVAYAGGVLRVNVSNKMLVERAQTCRAALQQAIMSRVGAVTFEFAVGEVPKEEGSDELDRAEQLLKLHLGAEPVE